MLATVTGAAAADRVARERGEPSRPLRIVHVDTERGWGGGERQLTLLAKGLQERGHRVWAVARPDTRLAAELTRGGTPVTTLAPRVEWDPVAALRLRALMDRVRADLIHAHCGHAAALAALASVGSQTRIIVSRRVALPLRRNPLSRWKYGRVARFIAVSEHVRDVLRAGGTPEHRIGVARSGIDLSDLPARASEGTLTSLGVDRRRPLVVMVSALVGPHKDPETFVRAVASARAAGCDCQALLVGAGPLAVAADVARRRANLSGALRLTGFRSDALGILAAADVAVMTSRDEGLGTTLLDAMLAGVPIVATAAGGMREVVRDGIDGLLVPPGDATGLGAAIARVVSDGELRAALVASGRERVKQFGIERTVEATVREYRMTDGRVYANAGRGR